MLGWLWASWQPAVRWLALQSPMDGVLASLAGARYVKALFQVVHGTSDVAPDVLLGMILAMVVVYFTMMLMMAKGRLALWGFVYFFLSSDKKCKKPDDAQPSIHDKSCKRMKVVFIRHGESEWNAVFNEGSKVTMPIRLVIALVKEFLMFFEQDSLFFDSPLSSVGINQSKELMQALANASHCTLEKDDAAKPVKDLSRDQLVSMIRGDSGSTLVVASNLRRAISTGFIALCPRFMKAPSKDKVKVMTCLQEISRNVDTLALAPANTEPKVPKTEAKLDNLGDLLDHLYRTRFDTRKNSGNKKLKQKAIKRHEEFAKYLYEVDKQYDMVIVCGHSLWFREFFKSYLPKSSTHISKKEKLQNCGCVAFDFYQDSKKVHRIAHDSIKEIHGHFGGKAKHKKA